MTTRSSPGLRHLGQMLLDQDELEWQRDGINERQSWLRIGLSHECGWVGTTYGASLSGGFGWEVYDSGSGVLASRYDLGGGVTLGFNRTRGSNAKPWLGVDPAGQVLEVTAGTLLDEDGLPITVPNDGVWRTLVARFAVSPRERGTLTLVGGSATVVGVGTQFTRYGDSSNEKAALIRIDTDDTSNGNEGVYEVDTVTDDENMELVSAPPFSESGVKFRVQGRFAQGTPADPDIHHNPTVVWELVTRTTTRPADALVCYDVKRSAGTVSLIDRRRCSLFQPIDGRIHAYNLLPSWAYVHNQTGEVRDNINGITILSADPDAASEIVGLALAPAATGSHLGIGTDQATGMMLAVLYDDGSTRRIRIFHQTVVYGDLLVQWDEPESGSTVDVVSAAGLRDVTLVAVPSATGNTHLIFYVDSAGSVIQRSSTDNGATWSGATTIWNPAGADEVSRISAVLTRMGKLVLVGTHNTTSPKLRAIYSTDLGTSWDTNTNAGYGFTGSTANQLDVSVCEDDRGNLWTVSSVSATNMLRLWRGGAEGDAVPDTDEQTAGWEVGPDTVGTAVNYLEAFAFPGATIGVVCDLGSGSNRSVNFLSIARRHVLHHQLLVVAPNDGGADFSVPVAAGIAASGQVMLVWGSKEDTAGPVYTLKVKSLQHTPVQVPRVWTWYGGN